LKHVSTDDVPVSKSVLLSNKERFCSDSADQIQAGKKIKQKLL